MKKEKSKEISMEKAPTKKVGDGRFTVKKVSVINNKVPESAVLKLIEGKFETLDLCVWGLALRGEFEIKLKIDGKGNVLSLEVVKNEIGKAEKCFSRNIKKWLFPELKNTETITVLITLAVNTINPS